MDRCKQMINQGTIEKLWQEARNDKAAYYSWTDREESVIRSGTKITRQRDGMYRLVALFRGGESYGRLQRDEADAFKSGWSNGCKFMQGVLQDIKQKAIEKRANKTKKS